ncbi:ATP/GTP-binding protein [Chitinophaga sp. CB10]|uniref:AAA family ATPase n=1 Tax=Chitinophaga sp. CB10 TaxID=1891659 RepID=UPI000B1A0040|nr:ATP-binding protein [Chitinophaga sp. CB10]
MLVRFIVSNLFSFKEPTEFNMLPGRFNRLPHHVITAGNVNLLKLNAMYGANGAGKSNFIHALAILRDFLIDGRMPIDLITETFKFDRESAQKDVYLGIEFIKEDVPYYYGLTINQGIIVEEELQISGIGQKSDKVLFIRKDKIEEKDLALTFSKEVNEDREAALFPEFLKNEILERNVPVLFYMRNRNNKVFEPFKKALEWFERGLELILPFSKPSGLAMRLEKDENFRRFTVDLMKSFNTGIEDIHVQTIPIEEYFGEDNKHEAERIIADLRAKAGKGKYIHTHWEEVVFVLENNLPVAKRIELSHGEDNGQARFLFSEESDGTRRLLEYIPAIYSAVNWNRTFFIDEIERSIHPLLIKELIRKFSHDKHTKGQLIFSTHEANLLDQDIFRPDEIWFAEKNKQGATQLYPLSEFKEHHTIDIRKGYLNGRYGAIPFLGNLKDLNWEQYAEAN